MRASTRCASGDGVVLSTTVAAGVTPGAGSAGVGVVEVEADVDAGAAGLVGFPPVVAMGAQPVAAAIASAASTRPHLP
jgi:hypothetical protein